MKKDRKPFNWDKPFQTIDGRECRLLATDLKSVGDRTPYVVAVMGTAKQAQQGIGQDGIEQILCYQRDGMYPGGGPAYAANLVNVFIKTWKWMVLKDIETSDTKITRKNYSEAAAKEKFGGRLLMKMDATMMEEDTQ